jgi:hypothetical protein
VSVTVEVSLVVGLSDASEVVREFFVQSHLLLGLDKGTTNEYSIAERMA